MSTTSKLATVSAALACGLGVAATSASAYAISGGSFTGTGTASPAATISIHPSGPWPGLVTCTSATYTGTATGAASTSLAPAFSGCSTPMWGAVTVTTTSWTMIVTGGAAPTHGGSLTAGTYVTIRPVAYPVCTVTLTIGAPTRSVTQSDYAGGTTVSGSAFSGSGLTYGATPGCPGVPSTTWFDGSYGIGIGVQLPGVSITP